MNCSEKYEMVKNNAFAVLWLLKECPELNKNIPAIIEQLIQTKQIAYILNFLDGDKFTPKTKGQLLKVIKDRHDDLAESLVHRGDIDEIEKAYKMNLFTEKEIEKILKAVIKAHSITSVADIWRRSSFPYSIREFSLKKVVKDLSENTLKECIESSEYEEGLKKICFVEYLRRQKANLYFGIDELLWLEENSKKFGVLAKYAPLMKKYISILYKEGEIDALLKIAMSEKFLTQTREAAKKAAIKLIKELRYLPSEFEEYFLTSQKFMKDVVEAHEKYKNLYAEKVINEYYKDSDISSIVEEFILDDIWDNDVKEMALEKVLALIPKCKEDELRGLYKYKKEGNPFMERILGELEKLNIK